MANINKECLKIAEKLQQKIGLVIQKKRKGQTDPQG